MTDPSTIEGPGDVEAWTLLQAERDQLADQLAELSIELDILTERRGVDRLLGFLEDCLVGLREARADSWDAPLDDTLGTMGGKLNCTDGAPRSVAYDLPYEIDLGFMGRAKTVIVYMADPE